MAQAPQPPHKPAAPPPPLKTRADDHPPPAVGGGHVAKTGEDPKLDDHRPIIGVKGHPIEDGSRDPDTIAETQRRRSAEMEKKGIEAWKAEHDERSEEEKRGHTVVPPPAIPRADAPPQIEGAKHEDHQAP